VFAPPANAHRTPSPEKALGVRRKALGENAKNIAQKPFWAALRSSRDAIAGIYYSGHNNGNILSRDSLPTSDRILLGKSTIPKTFWRYP
jgi:hypothetical protein